MTKPLENRLLQATAEAEVRYHRFVLLVGQPRSGKTTALRAFANRTGYPVINLNLVLTQHLLELTRKQRALRVKRILAEGLEEAGADTVMLDNIESLFDPELAQDPLRLLQGLSRNRTIVSTWPGTCDGVYLTYAEPGHPEWRRYANPEASIVSVEKGPAPADEGTSAAEAIAQEKR